MRFVVPALVALVVVIGLVVPAAFADPPSVNWPMAGQNLANTHSQPDEHTISASNVPGLRPLWTFTALPSKTASPTSDISATPTVVDGVVYFPDWGGNLYAVNALTGKTIWARKISEYTGVDGTFSRTSPAFVDGLLILGDKPPSGVTGWGQGSGKGAHVFAVNASTGNLVWRTQVDDTFVSQITGSIATFQGIAYVGVSSVEEVTAAFVPKYVCCIFRGSAVALDVHTGDILWKTFDMPQGYTGGAIWGSTAAIDPQLGDLYVGTGNNYSVPPSVDACQKAPGTNCVSPDDHFDSIMALDLKTGLVKWTTGTLQFDNWTVTCFIGGGPNCPDPNSPDADFGSGPNLFSAGGTPVVGAGTKGGTYWTLDAATGKVIWATQVGPGGIFGGIEWGSAVADGRVYVAEANSAHVAVRLTNPAPGSRPMTSGGYWEALDATTGKVLWQSADRLGANPQHPIFGDIGQVATANGVVYAGSSDPDGHVYGLDARTGQIKWQFATGGSIASGAAIANGTVFWGSGYSQFATSGTTGNNKLFAFSLPQD